MARTKFSDVKSIDVIGNNLYEMIIPNIPGGSGVEKKLSIQCTGFEMPQIEVARLEVVVQGFRSHNSAGTTVFPGTFTASFVEDSSMSIYNAFRAWKEILAGTESGTTSGTKTDYSRDIILRVYNTRNDVACEVVMTGSFVQTIGAVSMQGTTAPDSVNVSITFSYDTCDLDAVTNR
jgi:hypothetical protein